MNVTVRGKNNFEPTEAIRNYAIGKISKLDQYFDEDFDASVVCKVYDTYQVVEVTIPTRNYILRAEAKDETVYGAIDKSVDKLEGQVRKYKTKFYSSIKRKEGIGANYASTQSLDLEDLQAEIKANNLVKSKEITLTSMTKDEAITQMELLDHSFFVFLDSQSNKTCVCYRREDGDYGVIETR